MTEEINLINRDPTLHLRDARHAHQFYTEHGHLFSPKVKFLYHVVFNIADINNVSYYYGKEIGVLAKSCDLPQYRINVETRKQYNRNRNFQTGINYEEIKIVFHDDNFGATSAMIEDYYRYYYRDGNKGKDVPGSVYDFSRNDLYKYGDSIPKYGYDSIFSSAPNGTELPPGTTETSISENSDRSHFFSNIIIFQLAKQQWTSFTLINPLITALGHDTLDNTDGSGIMENTISVAYEGVVYHRGNRGDNSEPRGFTDPETRYDTIHSPLISVDTTENTSKQEPNLGDIVAALSAESTEQPLDLSNAGVLNSTSVPNLSSLVQQLVAGGGVQGTEILNPDSQNTETVVREVAANSNKRIDPDQLTALRTENPDLYDKGVFQSLVNGSLEPGKTFESDNWTELNEDQKDYYRDKFYDDSTVGVINVSNVASKLLMSSSVLKEL